MKKIFQSIFLTICILLLHLQTLPAQSDGSFFISADTLQKYNRIWLNAHWRYHPGDDPAWANPEFDDREWEAADPELAPNRLPKSGWPGVGWFRIPVAVDSALWRQPFILTITHAGAAQIYLNGEPLYDYHVDARKNFRDYQTFMFSPQTSHVFAIRYSNSDAIRFQRAGRPAGFFFSIGLVDRVIASSAANITSDLIQQMVFTTVALAFGVLHLGLFAFSRKKSHLYFTIFVLLYAAHIFFDYQNFLATNLKDNLLYLRLHRAVMPYSPLFALLFLYSLFSDRVPKHFWLIAAALIISGIFAVLVPVENLRYVLIFVGVVFIETLRIMRNAIRNRIDGAWIIALGFLILAIFSSYDALLDFEVMEPFHDITNGYPVGFLGLILSMSIYLARDFARTNERVLAQEREAKDQEMQRRLLEADNARKTRELEDARQFQLSMLPQSLPEVPNLDIAVYMKTASEVGGDYYDFLLSKDGALTVVVGDATGHGTKAGIMVAAIKSLFHALGGSLMAPDFFNRCTDIMRGMEMGHLYMSMTLLRIKGKKMLACAAGMPPFMIYRAAANAIEEVVLKGMPLGAHRAFPYELEEIALAPGDAILLITDGFEELCNSEGEMFDYVRVKRAFWESAGRSPQEIVQHLSESAARWSEGQSQNDDITLVVLKVK
jgi:serine phosphatase RsbU (regulator of sigma subunit)